MALETSPRPPATPLIALADMKLHLRQDLSADDTLINQIIAAATVWAEDFLHRRFITQTVTMTIHAFTGRAIMLPIAPVQSITEIRYLDSAGVQQTLSTDVYKLSKGQLPFYVVTQYGQTWPQTRAEADAVEIEFVAGYGDAASDVPADIVRAVYMLAASMYENRTAEITGTIAQKLTFGPEKLLEPHILHV